MDLDALTKLAQDFGTAGLVIFFGWKLVDRWAGRFHETQKEQAGAMRDQATALTEVAKSVKEGEGEQREILQAVRVLAGKVDETKEYVEEIVTGARK